MDPVVEEGSIFERGVYLSIFYCLCFVQEISTDTVEEHVLEDRELDLDEEEDIRITYSREEHWRDVADDNEKDRSEIHALRWDVYMKEKEELIKREFFWWPLHTRKGGALFGLV